MRRWRTGQQEYALDLPARRRYDTKPGHVATFRSTDSSVGALRLGRFCAGLTRLEAAGLVDDDCIPNPVLNRADMLRQPWKVLGIDGGNLGALRDSGGTLGGVAHGDCTGNRLCVCPRLHLVVPCVQGNIARRYHEDVLHVEAIQQIG